MHAVAVAVWIKCFLALGDTIPPLCHASLNLCSLCVYYGNYCIFLKVFFFSLNKIRSNLQCGVTFPQLPF